MNSVWLDTLQSLGLEIDNNSGVVTSSSSSASLVPLTHQCIITINGPETEKFLQGQLSCHIGDVAKLGSRLGAHCNIKGHMISLYRVMKQASESYWLRSDRGLADKALTTLKKYILFSKAEAALDDNLVGLGLMGDNAAALATQLVGELPTEIDGVTRNGNRLLVKVPGGRFECWLPAADAVEWLNSVADLELGGTDSWLLEDIRAGVADLRLDTSEAFIPQMTNLQVYEGVSFTKGCYTGQEVVTRLQHRGILKRPMYRAAVTASERPQPGQALHTAEKENIGQVVIAAPVSTDRYELLAVIVKEQAENTGIHLGTADGPALELLDLPYTLDPNLFESKR